MSEVLLSICIPTYNRVERLKEQVTSLLSVKDERFNIIVSDNKSMDNTSDFLSTISDDRLQVFKQDSVPSSRNITNALINANGKYSLLLLDKDRLHIDLLPNLLDELEKSKAQYGYCSLKNEGTSVPCELMECNIHSFVKMSYTCKHPSGDFFESKRLKKEIKLLDRLIDAQFPFVYDIIFAHFAANSNGEIIHFPVVTTETENEAAAKQSYTYSPDNLWFSPRQVVDRYLEFLKDLNGIDVEKTWKNKMKGILLRRCFVSGTKGYAQTMRNEKICAHYGIGVRNISKKELLDYYKLIYSKLRNNNVRISSFSLNRALFESIVITLLH